MAVITSRANKKGAIIIDKQKCTGCGKCVEVCKDFSLKLEAGKVEISETPVFGCIGCGHCMAICPEGAIVVSGRAISEEDIFEFSDDSLKADYASILSLYKHRRSIREFKNQPVEKEKIEAILDAASYSPMGLPPTDVHVLVMDSVEKGRRFASDFCNYLGRLQWITSNWFLGLMRPFWGKETDRVFRGFVKPLIRLFREANSRGENLVTYDAPLCLYFYATPFADPADPIVAATSAMYAAEALGLGTVMLGGVHPLLLYGSAAAKFRRNHKIKFKSREGLILAVGYPKVRYQKGIRRTFASVDYL